MKNVVQSKKQSYQESENKITKSQNNQQHKLDNRLFPSDSQQHKSQKQLIKNIIFRKLQIIYYFSTQALKIKSFGFAYGQLKQQQSNRTFNRLINLTGSIDQTVTKEIFKSNIQIFSISEIGTVCILLTILYDWISYNPQVTLMSLTTMSYLQYQTCPLTEQKSDQNLEWIQILLLLIYKIFETVFFNLIFTFLLKNQEHKKTKRNTFVMGSLIITFITLLMVLFDFPFDFARNDLICLLLKTFGNNVLAVAFRHINLKISNIYLKPQITFSNYSLLCTFFLKFACYLIRRDINTSNSLFTYISLFLATLFLLLMFFKSSTQMNKATKIKYKILSFYYLKYCSLAAVVSLYLICLSQFCGFHQYYSGDIRTYLYLLVLLQICGLFALIVLKWRTVQLQNQIFLISESFISSQQPIQKDNEQIEPTQCLNCLSQPSRFFYQNCGHLCYGNNCVVSLLEKRISICPICQQYSGCLVEIKRVDNNKRNNRKFKIINKYNTVIY